MDNAQLERPVRLDQKLVKELEPFLKQVFPCCVLTVDSNISGLSGPILRLKLERKKKRKKKGGEEKFYTNEEKVIKLFTDAGYEVAKITDGKNKIECKRNSEEFRVELKIYEDSVFMYLNTF